MNLDARQILGALLGGLLLLAIGGLSGWVLTVSDRVARTEERYISSARRLSSLEGGISTPISREATARFEKVDVSLLAISQRLGSLESLVSELNRRLRDGRAEGKLEPKLEPKGG